MVNNNSKHAHLTPRETSSVSDTTYQNFMRVWFQGRRKTKKEKQKKGRRLTFVRLENALHDSIGFFGQRKQRTLHKCTNNLHLFHNKTNNTYASLSFFLHKYLLIITELQRHYTKKKVLCSTVSSATPSWFSLWFQVHCERNNNASRSVQTKKKIRNKENTTKLAHGVPSVDFVWNVIFFLNLLLLLYALCNVGKQNGTVNEKKGFLRLRAMSLQHYLRLVDKRPDFTVLHQVINVTKAKQMSIRNTPKKK